METWKYFDITHREHKICNPTSEAKLSQLIDLLRLKPGDRMLDIATGKGEFILRMAEKYHISGVGIDLSPYCIRDAKEKLQKRAPQASVEFIEMEGRAYKPEAPHLFNLAACIGASWIFDGHEGTLKALLNMVKPGGWIVTGEPFWIKEPPAEYLDATGIDRAAFGTHYSNVQIGETLGLTLVQAIVSNHDDWDYYEGMQWYAADQYARENPEDPDIPELLQTVWGNQASYLRWGRDCFGWALYIFRTPILTA